MPGYVSHTIMARDVYKRINKRNVSIDYMLTYSLGGDLCKYSKCRKDSHRISQDKFIDNMCKYIKDNNLSYDSKIMGVLYGHISHYVMDMVLHPLIREIDKKCQNVGISSHTLIEGYIDSYLVKYKYDVRVDLYNDRQLFKGKMKKEIYKMINWIYKETYDTDNVALFYIFNIFLYRKISLLYKIFGLRLLRKYSKFDKFINENKKIDLVNDKNMISYKNYLGNESCDNLLSLYDDSLNITLKYIDEVNKYLGID